MVNGRLWSGGDSTGERRIVMDVEFEEVEEGVCNKRYGTVHLCAGIH